MNKTFGIIIGLIIVVGAIGWLVLSQNKNPVVSNPAPETTTGQTTNSLPAGLPVVVTNRNAIPTDTTVVVTGSVIPNGAFTSYWYEYGPTPEMGSKTANQIIGSGFMATPAPSYITGLTKDTTYYFRLGAQNQFGQVSNGQYSFTTTHGYAPPVGTAPTSQTLPVSGLSRTTANLNGAVTPNRAETQSWFEYGLTANLGNTSALVSAGNGSAKVLASMSLVDLAPSTTYYFRLNAQNQFGTVNGAILNFRTNGPAASTAPVVTTRSANQVGTSTVMLRGSVNPSGAETKYWFEYSQKPLVNDSAISSTGQSSAGDGLITATVSVAVMNLDSLTTYYFRLVAENSVGLVRGEQMSFKTK